MAGRQGACVWLGAGRAAALHSAVAFANVTGHVFRGDSISVGSRFPSGDGCRI